MLETRRLRRVQFQEHLKTMVYAIFGGQIDCIMGHSKIENCFLTFSLSSRGNAYQKGEEANHHQNKRSTKMM